VLNFLHGTFSVFLQEIRQHLDLDLARLRRVLDARPPLLTKLTRVLGCYQMLRVPRERHLRRRHEAAHNLLAWLRRLQRGGQSTPTPLVRSLDGPCRAFAFAPALPQSRELLEPLQSQGCHLIWSVDLPLELPLNPEISAQMNLDCVNAYDREQLKVWGLHEPESIKVSGSQ
jgi:hypothetical protein